MLSRLVSSWLDQLPLYGELTLELGDGRKELALRREDELVRPARPILVERAAGDYPLLVEPVRVEHDPLSVTRDVHEHGCLPEADEVGVSHGWLFLSKNKGEPVVVTKLLVTTRFQSSVTSKNFKIQ